MNQDNDKQHSKIEQEIMEILEQTDDEPTLTKPKNVVQFRKRRRNPLKGFRERVPDLRQTFGTLTPAKLLAATIIFAVGAVLAQGFSGMLSILLVLAAIVAFFGLFVVRSSPGGSISKPGGPGSPRVKRWRGRDIVLEPRQDSDSRNWKRFLPGQKD